MTLKDILEIGLKEDAPYRRDNLPDFQKDPNGPEEQPGDPTRSPEEPGAREAAKAAQASHPVDTPPVDPAPVPPPPPGTIPPLKHPSQRRR